MTPLTENFVKQLVSASKQKLNIPLAPAEMQELAEVWLTFRKVMAAIVTPDDMQMSVHELYSELATNLSKPKTESIPKALSAPPSIRSPRPLTDDTIISIWYRIKDAPPADPLIRLRPSVAIKFARAIEQALSEELT